MYGYNFLIQIFTLLAYEYNNICYLVVVINAFTFNEATKLIKCLCKN